MANFLQMIIRKRMEWLDVQGDRLFELGFMTGYVLDEAGSTSLFGIADGQSWLVASLHLSRADLRGMET